MSYDSDDKDLEETREILEDVAKNVEKCVSFYSRIFEEGREDQDFVNGLNQWGAQERRSRDIDGLPTLVLNQMKPFAAQVVNNIRQTRPAIRVVPVDNHADKDTAEVFSGIIRNIEYQSKANDAYDTGAKNAVETGLGWIKVCVDYASEYSFDQEIYIERIINHEGAMLDPNAKKLDGSDADYGFVIIDIDKDEFEDMYPDADPSGYDIGFWSTEGTVRVLDYYYKEYEDRTIYSVSYTQDDKTVEGVIDADEKKILEEQLGEIEVIEERKIRRPKIKQCLVTQNEVLDSTDWQGKYIPIIPVVGDEVWVEGRRYFHSLIRQGKDAQRMYNYWKSASTAMIALQPKAPVTGPVGSFSSFPDEWAASNKKNLPFLEWDPVYGEDGQLLPPPMRQPPIQGSPAMMQEAMSAREDIRLAIGMGNANMGQEDNAVSGVAIRNRQIEGDNATFHFMDNLASSITQVGCILVDLIPKIYNKPQIKRILGQDNQEDLVPINQPFKEDKNGNKVPTDDSNYDGIYDLKAGKYDVVCDVGPSYSSQRQEMADKLTELIGAKPELMEVVGDMVFESLDLPNGTEIADRLRSLMDPKILGDDPMANKLQQASQKMQQMQEQLKSMDAALQDKAKNEQFEQAYKTQELQLKRDELAMKAQQAQADIAKTQSEIENNRVQTQQDRIENAQLMTELQGRIDDISEAFEAFLDFEESQLQNNEGDELTGALVIQELDNQEGISEDD